MSQTVYFEDLPRLWWPNAKGWYRVYLTNVQYWFAGLYQYIDGGLRMNDEFYHSRQEFYESHGDAYFVGPIEFAVKEYTLPKEWNK